MSGINSLCENVCHVFYSYMNYTDLLTFCQTSKFYRHSVSLYLRHSPGLRKNMMSYFRYISDQKALFFKGGISCISAYDIDAGKYRVYQSLNTLFQSIYRLDSGLYNLARKSKAVKTENRIRRKLLGKRKREGGRVPPLYPNPKCYVFKKDRVTWSKFHKKFYDECLEEITCNLEYVLKRMDVYLMKLNLFNIQQPILS